MGQELSILAREFYRRANEAYAASGYKQEPDLEEVVLSIIKDPTIVPDEVRTEAAEEVERGAKVREQQSHDLVTEISTINGSLLGQIDRCLAFVDCINRRLLKAVFKHGGSLKARNPRPRAEFITGAMLKCLLLLTLHAKVCSLSAEINCLLRNGFCDGALSRLRSVYEHIVVISLIALDHTYVVSERYQDYACFEELSRLRALKESMVDPATRDRHDPSMAPKVDEAISELEAAAREARALWGRGISQANDWARPMLSPVNSAKRRSTLPISKKLFS